MTPPASPCVPCVPEETGQGPFGAWGHGPLPLAWGTGQAPWAVTAAPVHRGHSTCQAWKAHQEKPGQGVLASARDADSSLCPRQIVWPGQAHCGFS